MTDKFTCPSCGKSLKCVPDEESQEQSLDFEESEQNGMGGLETDPKVAAAKRGIDERLKSYRK